jgi:hypothetical protein
MSCKKQMHHIIFKTCNEKYNQIDVESCMGRSYRGMFIEWYLHNIGYYLTLPFIKKDSIKKLNLRFKDVDLEEHFK